MTFSSSFFDLTALDQLSILCYSLLSPQLYTPSASSSPDGNSPAIVTIVAISSLLLLLIAFRYLFPSPVLSLQNFRLASACYLLLVNVVSVLSWEWLWLELDGDHWYCHFKYFTNWMLAASTLYFLSTLRCGSTDTSPLSRSLSVLSLPLSLLTAVVYWTAIFTPARVFYTSSSFLTMLLPLVLTCSSHGLSALLLTLDFCLCPALRYRWADSLQLMALGLLYHAVMTLDFLYTGVWLYEFLDWSGCGWLAVYAVFLLVFRCRHGTAGGQRRGVEGLEDRAAAES